jgi:hypothetical protein
MVQVTEPREKRLGQRFGVAAPDRAIQQHFEQLVVRHRIGAALGEALAQAAGDARGDEAPPLWTGRARPSSPRAGR